LSDSAERYLQAARRDSTQRRYAQAVEHFEAEWGGGLPASSENVVRYLAAYGAKLSSNTLRTHLAALAQWHQQHGFNDPTKASRVAIAHDQHADHQFRINRRAPNRAVEVGEVMAQIAQIETPINAAQKVIGWDVIFKVERVKQSLLPTR
jgi:hypothetical protein